MADTAIVLDGEQRAALAVVRSLGRRGVRVVVASAHQKPLASASRWCQSHHVLPDPAYDLENVVPALTEIARKEGAGVILPVTDASLTALVDCESLGDARIARPPREAYATISDKAALMVRANALGVPTPDTRVVSSAARFERALADWDGPVVIKPAVSRYQAGDAIRSTSVRIVDDREAALAMLPGLDWLESVPALLQTFIPGRGAGIFTVYGRDGPLAWFSHQRLREKPPSGGVSVLCESVPVNPKMQKHAQTLLNDAGWVGPAMVEFRLDPDGRPWLMEINGRFWGSLQLAIDSGLDLPWLWYQAAIENDPKPVEAYMTGNRLRWLLGDLDSLYLTLRAPDLTAGLKIRAVFRFLNFFSPRTRLEVLRLKDVRPFFRELGHWLRSAFGRSNT